LRTLPNRPKKCPDQTLRPEKVPEFLIGSAFHALFCTTNFALVVPVWRLALRVNTPLLLFISETARTIRNLLPALARNRRNPGAIKGHFGTDFRRETQKKT
jgi:hypothetical protein